MTGVDQHKSNRPDVPGFIERRGEERAEVSFPVQVYGKDAHGFPFLRWACARNVSASGARIEGVLAAIQAGDIVGVHCHDKAALFRVAWVLMSKGSKNELVIGVICLEPQKNIWDSAGR